ncbi:MAG: DUF427 domain-containing protein [Pseudomonadota bacterium]
MFNSPKPTPPAPGQESVWDYPRPAICEPTSLPIRVVFGGKTIAETDQAQRTLETSHPPTYYLPPASVLDGVLYPSGHRTLCEWKGQARYFDVVIGSQRAANAAWAYDAPTPAFAPIKGYVAFYPALMEACFVDGERVEPQPGGFYGGWVTSHVAGPFKGGPGSMGW